MMSEISRSGKAFSPAVASSRISDGVMNHLSVMKHGDEVMDKSNEGDMGHEAVSKVFKKKSPSEEKLKHEMVFVGPFSEFSFGVKGCEADRNGVVFGSKGRI
ncbi:hypothetical protein QYF36_016922 [Acer negundo]|nr:hypothetical protein QYF36_016922 [Acer negundo]